MHQNLNEDQLITQLVENFQQDFENLVPALSNND